MKSSIVPIRDRLALADTPKVAARLALAVVLLLVSLAAAFVTFGLVAKDAERVEHTLQAEAGINRLAAHNEQLETARRGYLLQTDPEFIEIMRRAQADIDGEIARLRVLLSDNDIQTRRLTEIEQFSARRDEVVERNILSPAVSVATARESGINREAGVILTRAIRATAADMIRTENQLLTVRNRQQVSSLTRFYVVGGVAIALLVLVLLSVIVLVLRYNRELLLAESKLRTANEGLEESVASRTAELLRANQEIQRFAYIVSHDLRSPLVNVLGFTSELDEARKIIRRHLVELYEQNPDLRDEAAWVAVEEDLPEALGFIRSSTEKMDRLINSILELSRQGRRVLRPERLDMDVLIAEVVASLHQLAESSGATVTAGPIPPIESDRIAVEQILSNLVENSIKYLSPNRAGTVKIEGSRSSGMVHIDVIDNGRGIGPEDHQRVFDLFRRAGSQDQPGEGIGLANVRALAYRLGGTIEVESQLDQGARFRLSLPAKFVSLERAE